MNVWTLLAIAVAAYVGYRLAGSTATTWGPITPGRLLGAGCDPTKQMCPMSTQWNGFQWTQVPQGAIAL